jgi:hypothetical protein
VLGLLHLTGAFYLGGSGAGPCRFRLSVGGQRGTGIPEARVAQPEWPEEVGILGSAGRVTISAALRRRRKALRLLMVKWKERERERYRTRRDYVRFGR